MRDSAVSKYEGSNSFLETEPSIKTMEMSESKPYLYSNSCPESCICLSKKMQSDFDPIFKLASVFGISFSSSDKNSETKVKSNKIKKIYDIVINVIAVTSLITTVSFAHNFALSNAMVITYSIKFFGALLIRLNLLMQCSKVPVLFEHLSELYTEVSSCSYRSLKLFIILECYGILLLNTMMLVVSHLNLYYETRIQDLPRLSFLGHNITNDGTLNVAPFVFVAYSLNVLLSTFGVSTCILVCMNVHIILRRVINSYGKKLIENLKKNPTKEELTEIFVTFRRIICGINEADSILSFSTFFAYVTCISCFFYILSSFLVSGAIENRPFFAVEHFCVFLFSNFIFLTITISASKVTTAVDNLKSKVNCMSEIVMAKNLPTDVMLNFMIMIDNIRSTNIGMTGWGMFTITRGFVLTTVGVMITYGMILFQFG